MGEEGLLACVISSLADRGRRTSAYRKLGDVVEIRCDWAATHTALQKNIDPSSEFLLNTVQERDDEIERADSTRMPF